MRRREKIVCRFLAPFDGWKEEEEGKASSGVGKGPPSLRSRPTGGAFNRVSEVGRRLPSFACAEDFPRLTTWRRGNA